LTPEQQGLINDFVRRHVDTSTRPKWNAMTFEMKNGFAHDEAVFRCCRALKHLGIPFATEVRLKCGNVADIICPCHVAQIIEVMSTETDHAMTRKLLRMPASLRDEVKILKAEDVNRLEPEEIDEGVFIR